MWDLVQLASVIRKRILPSLDLHPYHPISFSATIPAHRPSPLEIHQPPLHLPHHYGHLHFSRLIIHYPPTFLLNTSHYPKVLCVVNGFHEVHAANSRRLELDGIVEYFLRSGDTPCFEPRVGLNGVKGQFYFCEAGLVG